MLSIEKRARYNKRKKWRFLLDILWVSFAVDSLGNRQAREDKITAETILLREHKSGRMTA